jgi:hypothetical protein
MVGITDDFGGDDFRTIDNAAYLFFDVAGTAEGVLEAINENRAEQGVSSGLELSLDTVDRFMTPEGMARMGIKPERQGELLKTMIEQTFYPSMSRQQNPGRREFNLKDLKYVLKASGGRNVVETAKDLEQIDHYLYAARESTDVYRSKIMADVINRDPSKSGWTHYDPEDTSD